MYDAPNTWEIHFPKGALINHRENRMDVQEVFSNKFVEYGPRRQMEATLILKEFEVFWCNVG